MQTVLLLLPAGSSMSYRVLLVETSQERLTQFGRGVILMYSCPPAAPTSGHYGIDQSINAGGTK